MIRDRDINKIRNEKYLEKVDLYDEIMSIKDMVYDLYRKIEKLEHGH